MSYQDCKRNDGFVILCYIVATFIDIILWDTVYTVYERKLIMYNVINAQNMLYLEFAWMQK